MIKSLTWETTSETNPIDDHVVDEGLTLFNQGAAPLDEVQPLRCVARLTSGKIAGGAVARTWGRCCSLDMIWVDDAYRRHGIASKLIQLVEAEAVDRGCSQIFLETFNFQAPELYLRLGYEIACQLDGFPDGITKFIFRKALSLESS